MWIKATGGSYRHTNGATIAVGGSGSTWRIDLNNTGNPLANGFATEASAQATLDTFMNEQGFEQIPNGS